MGDVDPGGRRGDSRARAQGWSKSAIARHTGRDRKTVAKYLAGNGPKREPAPSCLEPFRAYLESGFVDDPHVRASVLFEELVQLGFDCSYPDAGPRDPGARAATGV